MTAFAFCQKNFYIAPKMQPATGMFPPKFRKAPAMGQAGGRKVSPDAGIVKAFFPNLP